MRPTTKSLIAAAALLLGTSAQAQAQTVRLTAVLSGGERSPDADPRTGATGTAEVFVNLATKDVTYTIKVFNIPSGTTAGHFHVGPVGRRRPGGGRPRAAAANISNDFIAERHGHRRVAAPACRAGHPRLGRLHPVAGRRTDLPEHPQHREPGRGDPRTAHRRTLTGDSVAFDAHAAATVGRPAGRPGRPSWPFIIGGMKLSVVMPCFNEQATIREIVARVQAVDLGPIDKEILIVDDGSTDGTRDILAKLDGTGGVRVFLQATNQGKGAAVARGFAEATGDVVIIQDADLEYDPQRVSAAAAADPRGQGRRRLRLALPRRPGRPPRALLLALDRQPAADAALERRHRPQPHRHGDLLQGLRARRRQAARPAVARLRHRARDHLQGGADAGPHLRGADFLQRPHLRRRQEDRPEGRLQGGLHADPLLALGGARPATSARSRCGAWKGWPPTTAGCTIASTPSSAGACSKWGRASATRPATSPTASGWSPRTSSRTTCASCAAASKTARTCASPRSSSRSATPIAPTCAASASTRSCA